MYPEQATSWTPPSNSQSGEQPAAVPKVADPDQPQAWRPRPSASHLSRAANGVFYLRLVIPEHVRRLRPDLPREIRRSTRTTSKVHALRHAREMWTQLTTSFTNAGTAMLVTDSATATPPQGFLIEYVDGRLRADLYKGAGAEVRRLYMHLVETAAGFDAPAAAAPTPPPTPTPAPAPPAAPADVERDTDPIAPAADAPPIPLEPEPSGAIEWLSDAIWDWRTNAPHTFQDHTWIHAYRPSFRVFLELVGNTRRDIVGDMGEIEHAKLDIRCRDLTPEHMRQWHDLLKRLPQRQGKRDDGVEALDLILAAEAQERAVKKLGETHRPRQSDSNIVKKLEHVKPLVEYMLTNRWISHATRDKFKLELAAASANQSKARQISIDPKPGAICLSQEDLRRTFESPAYLDGASQCDWKYWLPPMLLTSGGRVGELSQLYTNDIVHVLGIPCFSFVWDSPDDDEDDEGEGPGRIARKARTEHEFRRLKSEASRRIIPIHPELLKLGFMQWVERRQSEVGTRPGLLFRDLKWALKSGYGRKPSQYVLELLKASGVWVKRKKVCHSLRATCVQELRRVGMPKDERQRFIGHSTKSQEEAAYSETQEGPNCPAELMLMYLNETNFGVTFPTYVAVRELQIKRAREEQLGRKNSAARRRMQAAGTH